MDDRQALDLLESITKDNLTAFDSCMETAPCGAYRLGRFPVLSVLYLFNAKKILKKYEGAFLKYRAWEELYEPPALAAAFRKTAGKCLRFYLNEIVSPVEMLLLLNRERHLKEVFPAFQASPAVKDRLVQIYSLRYGLRVSYEGQDIRLEKRPLTRAERKKRIISVTAIALSAVIALSTPFVVNAFVPFIGVNPSQPQTVTVNDYSKIDFASKNTYRLGGDITLPDGFRADTVNCNLVGMGHRVIFRGGDTPFGTLNGGISDINFETTGTPLIETVSAGVSVEEVNVKVVVNGERKESSSFFVLNNYGVLDGVKLSASGELSVSVPQTAETSYRLAFGGLALLNYRTFSLTGFVTYGMIKNCSAEYSLTLRGTLEANATFAGLVGLNYGQVTSSAVSGKITADTLDLAGVCVANYNQLSQTENGAELYASTSEADWNPIVAGITVENEADLTSCVNRGKLTAKSDCTRGDWEGEPAATAAGIVYRSSTNNMLVTPSVKYCNNFGEVTATAEAVCAFATGIVSSSSGKIEDCENRGDIKAETDASFAVYGAGIVIDAGGYVYKSVNAGNVTGSGKGEVYLGGIAAVTAAEVIYVKSEGSITASGDGCYAGGIVGYAPAKNIYTNIHFCISESHISVSSLGKKQSCIGGIVGFLAEAFADAGTENELCVGARVADSYFIGTLSGGDNAGGIVGACGKTLLASNGYTVNGTAYTVLGNNFYTGEFLSVGAGVQFSSDDPPALLYSAGKTAGATKATKDSVTAQSGYLAILSMLNAHI